MATFTWTGAGNTDWTEPTNWQVGGVATDIAPNDPTADAVATINGPDSFEFPIISGGAAITLNSLTAAGTAHVIVGGGQLGGTGTGSLNALGSISVTSTDPGGGLVGASGSTITTPSLTVGAGAAVGGGGTYIVTSLVNSGIIQGDGANFGLGTLTVTGGTITGPGSIEVDGPSTFELGSATAETITVVAALRARDPRRPSFSTTQAALPVRSTFSTQTPTSICSSRVRHRLVPRLTASP